MQRHTHMQARTRRLLLASAAGLLACGLAVGATGASGASGAGTAAVERDRGAAMQRDGISLDEAIDRAQKRYRARVVRAEQSESGGRVVYVLRLLSDEDGRVFTVRVDAQSGAMR